MALRLGTEHGSMLCSGDGYVTAWFMYWLQDDEYAGGAFFGETAEIRSNAYRQDTDVFSMRDEVNKEQ